jgi:hypothetical protein
LPKATYPERRSWNVLEDNDPSGFKSAAGRAGKAEAKIVPFEIPKRSPDLSVCDYFLWPEINRRMRQTEQSWGAARRETRAEYLKRLRRTAMKIPRALIDKAIGDLRRRCQLLIAAEGGHFEEGGN